MPDGIPNRLPALLWLAIKHHWTAEIAPDLLFLVRVSFTRGSDHVWVVWERTRDGSGWRLAACELLGYSREELTSSIRISDIHPHELPLFQAFSQEVFQNESAATENLSCMTAAGRCVPVRVHATLYQDEAGRKLIRAIVVDKLAEEAAAQALALQGRAMGRAVIDLVYMFYSKTGATLCSGGSAEGKVCIIGGEAHLAALERRTRCGTRSGFSNRAWHVPSRPGVLGQLQLRLDELP